MGISSCNTDRRINPFSVCSRSIRLISALQPQLCEDVVLIGTRLSVFYTAPAAKQTDNDASTNRPADRIDTAIRMTIPPF